MNLSRLQRGERGARQGLNGIRVWRLCDQQQEVRCYNVRVIRELVGSE